MTFDEFEAQVETLMEQRPSVHRGRIWMRHLSIVNPELHEEIQGRWIDPRRHLGKLDKARSYARDHWAMEGAPQ